MLKAVARVIFVLQAVFLAEICFGSSCAEKIDRLFGRSYEPVNARLLNKFFRKDRVIRMILNDEPNKPIIGKIVTIDVPGNKITLEVEGQEKTFDTDDVALTKTIYYSEKGINQLLDQLKIPIADAAKRQDFIYSLYLGQPLHVEFEGCKKKTVRFLGFVDQNDGSGKTVTTFYFYDNDYRRYSEIADKVTFKNIVTNASISNAIGPEDLVDVRYVKTAAELQAYLDKLALINKNPPTDQQKDKLNPDRLLLTYKTMFPNLDGAQFLKDLETIEALRSPQLHVHDNATDTYKLMTKSEWVKETVKRIKEDQKDNQESIGGNAGNDLFNKTQEARILYIDFKKENLGGLLYVGVFQSATGPVAKRLQEGRDHGVVYLKRSTGGLESPGRWVSSIEFIDTNESILKALPNLQRLILIDFVGEVLAELNRI